MKIVCFICVVFVSMIIVGNIVKAQDPINHENPDTQLIVFVSGLGGPDTWQDFHTLIKAEEQMKSFELLFFDARTDENIEENAQRLFETLSTEPYSNYEKKFFVAHSIGGIITKKYIVSQLESAGQFDAEYIFFYGTPHINDKFLASITERIVGWIFSFFIPELTKDTVNRQKIREINTKWIELVEKNNENHIPNVSIFGKGDKRVKIEDPANAFVGDFVIIPGDHLQIVKSKNRFDCPFQTLRKVLLEKNIEINVENCSKSYLE